MLSQPLPPAEVFRVSENSRVVEEKTLFTAVREPIVVVKEKVSSVFLLFCVLNTTACARQFFCVTHIGVSHTAHSSRSVALREENCEREKLKSRSGWGFSWLLSIAAELDCLAVVRS